MEWSEEAHGGLTCGVTDGQVRSEESGTLRIFFLFSYLEIKVTSTKITRFVVRQNKALCERTLKGASPSIPFVSISKTFLLFSFLLSHPLWKGNKQKRKEKFQTLREKDRKGGGWARCEQMRLEKEVSEAEGGKEKQRRLRIQEGFCSIVFVGWIWVCM